MSHVTSKKENFAFKREIFSKIGTLDISKLYLQKAHKVSDLNK